MDSARDFYRVIYPMHERPVLVLQDDEWPVFDLSETGIRYEVATGDLPEVGEEIYGEVRFQRGDRTLIAAEVVRIEGRRVALRMEQPGVPFRILLEEQQFLRSKYIDQE